MYHSVTIRLDAVKTNKDMRRKIEISIIIDEIKGRLANFRAVEEEPWKRTIKKKIIY
jgi:hypothetical protein